MRICTDCPKKLNKITDLYRKKCWTCRNKIYKKVINERKRHSYDPKKKQEYYLKNQIKIKARTAARHIQRRKIDIQYRLADYLRSRLRKALKATVWKKNVHFHKYIGCSLEELKLHLEKQFKTGMNWDNYNFRGWHIDHIIPLSSAKTEEELYKLCHYTNLQPLWAIDNLKKGNRTISL